MHIPVHIVSAAALVARGSDVLLLRSPRRGWEFPGGQVEQGESVTQGLLREIFEETGITARVTAFVGAYNNLAQKEGYGALAGTRLPPILNLTFLCEYESGQPHTSSESLEVKWVSRDEARRLVTFEPFVQRLSDMLDFDGHPTFCAFKKEAVGDVEWVESIKL